MTPTSGPRRQQRMTLDARRAQLVKVAQAAFVRDGSAVSTKAIAAEAGVHEALLFQHFGSKDGLFKAAVMEPLRALVAELREAVRRITGLDGDRSALGQLLDEVHTEMLAAMTEIVPLLGVALFSDVRAGREFYRADLQPVLEEIAAVTREGTAGWRRPGLDPTVLATATVGIHFAYGVQAMFVGDVRPEEIGPQVADLLWLGQVGVEPTADGAAG
ncbi:MAG: TetR/AcrR family transcriptional regulator [Acidimicrobiia bacterium]